MSTQSSADRCRVASLPRQQRSAVTNGSTLYMATAPVDGRSAEARRFRDVLEAIVSDLGGSALLSEGQRQLARRCAMLSVQCERLEAAAVAGEPFDADLYGTLTDRLGRAFGRLGLKRQAKPVRSSMRDRVMGTAE